MRSRPWSGLKKEFKQVGLHPSSRIALFSFCERVVKFNSLSVKTAACWKHRGEQKRWALWRASIWVCAWCFLDSLYQPLPKGRGAQVVGNLLIFVFKNLMSGFTFWWERCILYLLFISRDRGEKITQTWIFTSLSSAACPSVTKGNSPKPPFQTESSETFYWPFPLKSYWNKERCRCFIKDAICIFLMFRVSFLVCNLCDWWLGELTECTLKYQVLDVI